MNTDSPGRKSRAKLKRKPEIIETNEDALKWCHSANVTLRFTRSHVAAFYSINPKLKAVGAYLTDVVNELRAQKHF